MWYRVFGASEAEIQPGALLEYLQRQGLNVQAHFRGDDQGWFRAELAHDGLPLTLERFLVNEEGVRAELNNWAAWIELQENNPNSAALMQQIIATRQMFIMQLPEGEEADSPLHALCGELCRYLAETSRGIYQVDDQGLFSAEGNLLVAE
jgi:hypothetical protein